MTEKPLYNETIFEPPVTSTEEAPVSARPYASLGTFQELAGKYKELYNSTAPVAYAGYIRVNPEDTEVKESLRILREAGLFDAGKYVGITSSVTSNDEEFLSLQNGDYEVLVYSKPAVTESSTPTDELIFYPSQALNNQMAHMITYADIEYASDMMKLYLPTAESLLKGYTASPIYKTSRFEDLGPSIEYGENGISYNGEFLGKTVEDFADHLVAQQTAQAQQTAIEESSANWLGGYVDTGEGSPSSNVRETGSLDYQSAAVMNQIMADGEREDILSLLALPLLNRGEKTDNDLSVLVDMLQSLLTSGLFLSETQSGSDTKTLHTLSELEKLMDWYKTQTGKWLKE